MNTPQRVGHDDYSPFGWAVRADQETTDPGVPGLSSAFTTGTNCITSAPSTASQAREPDSPSGLRPLPPDT